MIWVCRKCGKQWHHQVERCIYCGKAVEKLEPKRFKVKGVTEVFLPSTEHSSIPYYSMLLEDEYGFVHTHKTNERRCIGEVIEIGGKTGSGNKVIGIVGAGVLGKDITKVMLQAGFKVILKGRDKHALSLAKEKIESHLSKHFSAEEKDRLMKNLKVSTEYRDLKKAGFVLECVTEDKEAKKEVFRELEKACRPKTVFATNTSSLSIDELASALKDPGRLVGMHFFNPATKMRLVEVINGTKTVEDAVEQTIGLVESIHKVPVKVRDSPAFIANRILMPYLNEAICLLSEGAAKKEDIDTTAKLALNHPMGPFQLLDLIGLDVFVEIMKNLHKSTGNPKYLPCPLAEKMVSSGKLGRKTGVGFYKYGK